MRILLFADTHGSSEAIRRIDQTKADLIIHAGDFSESGKYYESFLEACSASGTPTFFVSGNHECPNLCDSVMIDYDGVTCIDGKWAAHQGLNLFGICGYNLFNSDRAAMLDLVFENAMGELCAGFSILVSHEPPWPWYVKQQPCGCAKVAKFLNTGLFHLAVVGHAHERQVRVDDKHFKALRGCMVDVNLETKKFETWSP